MTKNYKNAKLIEGVQISLDKLTLVNYPIGMLFQKGGVKINYKLNILKE